MLLKEVTKLSLKPAMQKILCVSAAYQKTFVLVRVDRPGQEESIVHLDSNGSILWQRQYKDIINFFGMVSEKEVIILNVPDIKIQIVNLQTHDIIQLNHDYLFEDVAQMSIETFSQTRLFCVKEQGGHNDHRLQLTYYNYDGINDKSQPRSQWQSEDNDWTYDHMTRKANNHSKIIWWLYKHEQEITFNFFDLKEDPKGKMQVVKALNTLGNEYGIDNMQVGIGGLWETLPDRYMLVTSSSKSDHKAKDKKGVVNNNFILDATAGNDKGTLRQTKFTFEIDASGFSFNDQLIDFFRLGLVSVFYTFRHQKGEALETPVYYVSHSDEEIVGSQRWQCSCYRINFFFPAWDGNTVIQAEHLNGDCEYVIVSVNKIMDPKQISLHFLLAINQDLDDDLLQDAIELLHS